MLFLSNGALLNTVFNAYSTKCVQLTRQYDMAIVLGGFSSLRQESKRIDFNKASDRLFHTLKLLKENKVKRVLISSGNGTITKNFYSEGQVIFNWLLEMGYDSSQILFEGKSRNTYENALLSKIILDTMNPQSLLLVTSASHMPRAMAVFKKNGLHCDTYPVDCPQAHYRLKWIDLISFNGDNLSIWKELFHEWFGFVAYKIKGYL